MRQKTLEEYTQCPFHLAMNTLEGKWKFAILYVLLDRGTLRFKELERFIPDISTRMLVKELKHLEEKKIVIRKAYATVPPKVEYSLSEIGKSLQPVIKSISKWGEFYSESISKLDENEVEPSY
ncbi:DNA-binding HxlR family transcriptional regulator [Dyadobacter jejuensis]|uniref:DNA-binding HxlR family transcriptional regulator n=1 Tax=Dyadobacter jejuensis TaxID=1082580 RepID=A0A316AEB8_9BACT|nr:helix-turn-helix domain-containing protein [Dyadobacter jejuensis]PWJ55320.1 DNA-binding HxlR family transcriptional regulator [Dyadobacter jejuensis]